MIQQLKRLKGGLDCTQTSFTYGGLLAHDCKMERLVLQIQFMEVYLN